MITELATIEIADPAGVFAARQLGRIVAEQLELERQDQIRVATAMSEVGRSAVLAGQRAVVVFGADAAELILTVTVDGTPAAEGVAAARRLMDRVAVTGPTVLMARRRPADVAPDPGAIGARVAQAFPATAMDELRRQNQDLIAALDDLTRQKDQLKLLNSELEETNAGVMALYTQLSEELEQTNRGVVALYAELDDKSEQLRTASESKDRFWANVSHELRSPLNSIIGLARLLAEPAGHASLEAEQIYQVQLIKNSAGSLLALVNDLLDVAKAESGQLSVDPASVELPALLGRLRALVRPMVAGSEVSVIVSVDAAPDRVLTDELVLTSILRNLLSNAVKYTTAGEVRLSVRPDGAWLEISVTDTGIGIPAEYQDRVFEEFYQAPGVRRGGTGLGLPYARRLAELLGGGLQLTSEPGRGTTVTLRLPNWPARAGTIVVADDDPGFRAVLLAMLDGIAGRVVEAGDGAQALELMQSADVDLVLADLVMPGMDGTALLERLPEGIPVIVITGLDVPRPPRAAALLRKGELTRDRLAFTIRRVCGSA
jgi:signal transduction histidine kinase